MIALILWVLVALVVLVVGFYAVVTLLAGVWGGALALNEAIDKVCGRIEDYFCNLFRFQKKPPDADKPNEN